MSGEDIPVVCTCGALRLTIRDASPERGNHAVCYCIDCQAFARHLGQAERVLDDKAGTDLYQCTPSQVEIDAGADSLAVLQLAPRGLYRWYARCCDTPICNTLGTPKFAFASFLTANFGGSGRAVGPVRFRHKPEQATAPVTEAKGSKIRFLLRVARNAVRARLSGSWRKTPFFDSDTGRSIVRPRVLTDAERARAYREGEG